MTSERHHHWQAAFRHAVLDLALEPAAFWRLSLCEWRALIAAPSPGEALLRRDELFALMKAHPDQPARAEAVQRFAGDVR